MFKIPISIPHPHFDNSKMHVRQEIKRDHIQDQHNQKVHEYYRTKNQDWHKKRVLMHELHEYQDYLAINQYLNLKKHLEYGNYRYSITLGNNLDVFV
jgi:hypothetical protein